MKSEEVSEFLQSHGVKPTANRIVVLKALAAAQRPMSLSELETAILSIDKSGIFRALVLFREQHLVHVIEDGGDGVRYELCRSHNDDVDEDIHVHFYCLHCQKTFCLHAVSIPPITLPDGYLMDTVNYMVKGLCPQCSKHAK